MRPPVESRRRRRSRARHRAADRRITRHTAPVCTATVADALRPGTTHRGACESTGSMVLTRVPAPYWSRRVRFPNETGNLRPTLALLTATREWAGRGVDRFGRVDASDWTPTGDVPTGPPSRNRAARDPRPSSCTLCVPGDRPHAHVMVLDRLAAHEVEAKEAGHPQRPVPLRSQRGGPPAMCRYAGRGAPADGDERPETARAPAHGPTSPTPRRERPAPRGEPGRPSAHRRQPHTTATTVPVPGWPGSGP